MTIFNTLGRKVEEFKRQVEESTEDVYECHECGAEFHADYDECPECGSEAVERTETDDG